MKIVKVLFLDLDINLAWVGEQYVEASADNIKRELTKKDLKITEMFTLKIIRENSLTKDSCCYDDASPKLCGIIKKMTKRRKIGIVIIGNNEGIGFLRAKFVASEMKKNTVVVWGSYRKGDEKEYADMGFKHFCSRTELRDTIKKLLGVKARSA